MARSPGAGDLPAWDDGADEAAPEKGRIRVIVELAERAEHAENARAASLAAERTIESFTLDPGFPEVELPPAEGGGARAGRSAGLQAESGATRLVRGTIAPEDLDTLRSRPGVIAVHADARIAPFAAVAAPAETASPAAMNCDLAKAKGTLADAAGVIGADALWRRGLRGQGMTIGIVDGGVTSAGRERPGEPPGLARVTGGWPSDTWGTESSAWNAHGNMAATDALGAAPDAEVFDIRIAGPQSFISTAILAYRWAIDTYRADGRPQVLSNSWGIYQESWEPGYARDPNHPFTRLVVEALDAGMLVLFAAGNCGAGCPAQRCGPDVGAGRSIWGANGHPRVICVGAADVDRQWIGYSSQGPSALGAEKPDVCGIAHFRGYGPMDTGTSAACPLAAGGLALLRQAEPSLRQDVARTALRETARPLQEPACGAAGVIDVSRAYERVVTRVPEPWSPWGPWRRLGNAMCLYGAAATGTDAGVGVLAVGTDSQLYFQRSTSAPWTKLGNEAAGRPALASGPDGTLYAFTITADRTAHVCTCRAGAWSAWEAVGGCCLHGLASVCDRDGTPVLFAVGLDGRLYSCRLGGVGGPAAWRSLGGACVGPPAAVAQPDGRITVLALGTDAALYLRDAATDARWRLASRGPWLHGPATVAQNGRLEALVVDLGGRLCRLARDGDRWSTERVGGVCVAAPAAVRRAAELHVVVVGDEGALWERTRQETLGPELEHMMQGGAS